LGLYAATQAESIQLCHVELVSPSGHEWRHVTLWGTMTATKSNVR